MKNSLFVSIIILVSNFWIFTQAQITIVLQPGPDEGKDVSLSNSDAVNQGDKESLTAYTWYLDDKLALKRFFLEFDLSSIPEGAVITNAKLNLYYNPTDPYEVFDFQTGENEVFIQRITSGWDEHLVNWENQPTTTTDNQIELPASTSPTQDYLDIDVTELVKDMADTMNENHGFLMRMEDEINFYKGVLFASSDHADPSLWPKLEICYTMEPTDCITLKPNAEDGKDAFIWDLRPDNNYGTSYEYTIFAWTHDGVPAIRRCYIDFDLTQIPENSIIDSAELILYNDSTSLTSWGEHSQLSGSNAMIIQSIVDPWDEQEITWNNYPGYSTQDQVFVPESSSPHQNYHIDVTKLVQKEYEYPENNFGFKLQLKTEEFYRSVVFASSDHADTTLHPELKVCYSADTIVDIKDPVVEKIRIFPNPAHSVITVASGFEGTYTLEIVGLDGTAVLKTKITQPKSTVNISTLPAGFYVVKLSKDDFVEAQKLIVN